MQSSYSTSSLLLLCLLTKYASSGPYAHFVFPSRPALMWREAMQHTAPAHTCWVTASAVVGFATSHVGAPRVPMSGLRSLFPGARGTVLTSPAPHRRERIYDIGAPPPPTAPPRLSILAIVCRSVAPPFPCARHWRCVEGTGQSGQEPLVREAATTALPCASRASQPPFVQHAALPPILGSTNEPLYKPVLGRSLTTTLLRSS